MIIDNIVANFVSAWQEEGGTKMSLGEMSTLLLSSAKKVSCLQMIAEAALPCLLLPVFSSLRRVNQFRTRRYGWEQGLEWLFGCVQTSKLHLSKKTKFAEWCQNCCLELWQTSAAWQTPQKVRNPCPARLLLDILIRVVSLFFKSLLQSLFLRV